MDVPTAIGQIAKLKGEVKELGEDDKQICLLVSFVCEMLCDIDPTIKDKFIDRIEERLSSDFWDDHPRVISRARTLHYGLSLLRNRLADEQK